MKVYVNIPAAAEAGGCEALYQLVDAVNNCGGYSSIIWDRIVSNPVPDKYAHYNVRYGDVIEDSEENWVIYPEVWTEKIHTFKNMKKGIWWLSVNNNHNRFNEWENDKIHHFYQSNYALQHLLRNNVSYYNPLFDYINDKYVSNGFDLTLKENIVCYNPAKGREITNRIINMNYDIKFVPLVNMSENEVIKTLSKSKVYIDFGHHPGKDRIPRESAILNNCVITNYEGACHYHNDVPIIKRYKFNRVENVGEVIRDCFENFDQNLSNFYQYRNIIKNQKEEFINQVKQLF
jgi:hypothetical protein